MILSISKALLLLVSLLVQSNVVAFIWTLTDVLPANRVLQFSERHMFATQEGPDFLEQGDSYININMDVISYMEVNRSTEVGYAVFAANVGHEHDTLLGICSDGSPSTGTGTTLAGDDELDIHANTWAANVFSQRVVSQYVDTVNVHSIHFGGDMGLPNGTYHRWRATLNTQYPVNTEAWHNVAFQLCDSETADPKAHVDGTVTFHNPYGYLPGELFGFIPFEGLRTIMFAVFGVYYLHNYCKYRDSTLPLHKATLAVFLVAFIEAASWFIAYQTINETGTPYCCPFPNTVVLALVLQVFRATFSRMLLLVVCLGYGIVRPRLLTTEWIVVTIITTLYFIAAVVAHVSEIVMVHDVHDDSPEHVLAWQVPAMILDVILLSWIYLALGSTIRILMEFKQTNKLRMYVSLQKVITFFVSLFGIMTVFVLMDKAGIWSWPWQLAWLEQVLWEILNFGVLAAICVICKPSDNSMLLSYASQIPTDDPDDDADVDRYDDYDSNSSGSDSDLGDEEAPHFSQNVEVEMRNKAHNPVHKPSGPPPKKGLTSFNSIEDDDDFDLDN